MLLTAYTLLVLNDFSKSELTQSNFTFENDFIFNTDKYYTQSSTIDFIFENKINNFIKNKYNFSIRTDMYTPEENTTPNVIEGDMPYTSLLELSTGYTTYDSNDNSLLINFGIGYTGKYTYAKEIMKGVHSVLGANIENDGWDTQLDTKIILRATTNYKNKYKINNYIDYIHNTGLTLSNFKSVVNTGGQFRLGKLANNYGIYTNNSYNINYTDTKEKWYSYLFIGYNLKYKFNDITLRGLDIINHQYEYNFGISLKYNNFSINLINNIESKSFETQKGNNFKYSNIIINFNF